MRIQIFPIYIFTFLIFSCGLHAQMKDDLKNFLWEKDFQQIINRYAEEKIELKDAGDFSRRLEARPFREEPGMRIQTFAGSSRENAEKFAVTLSTLALDSVYVVPENGLYKVQLGNFTDRLEAEKMLDRLRFQGINNAWIVQVPIHVPRDKTIQIASADTTAADSSIPRILYSIQIFVTARREKAESLSQDFTNIFPEQVWIAPSGEYWKVLVGKFSQEIPARQRLDEIRNSGYPDAWLTQTEQ
jgi:hypothetical protein